MYKNRDYVLCSTYPEVLLFPCTADDSIIVTTANYRSSNRLPVLTYYDCMSGTSIWRSS